MGWGRGAYEGEGMGECGEVVEKRGEDGGGASACMIE